MLTTIIGNQTGKNIKNSMETRVELVLYKGMYGSFHK